MTDTTHLLDFHAAGIDWQCEVLFDGEGFAVQWVSQLDSPTEINGGALDAVGVQIPGYETRGETCIAYTYPQFRSLRSLAHAAAELDRDRIEARHRDDMDGARMDHAERRNEA